MNLRLLCTSARLARGVIHTSVGVFLSSLLLGPTAAHAGDCENGFKSTLTPQTKAIDPQSRALAFILRGEGESSEDRLEDQVVIVPAGGGSGKSMVSSPRYMLALGKTPDGRTIEIPTLVDAGVSEDAGSGKGGAKKNAPIAVSLPGVNAIAATPAKDVFIAGLENGEIFLVGYHTRAIELPTDDFSPRGSASITKLEFEPKKKIRSAGGLPRLIITRADGESETYDLSIESWKLITTYKKLVAKN